MKVVGARTLAWRDDFQRRTESLSDGVSAEARAMTLVKRGAALVLQRHIIELRIMRAVRTLASLLTPESMITCIPFRVANRVAIYAAAALQFHMSDA
jgi:hypothetical protein